MKDLILNGIAEAVARADRALTNLPITTCVPRAPVRAWLADISTELQQAAEMRHTLHATPSIRTTSDTSFGQAWRQPDAGSYMHKHIHYNGYDIALKRDFGAAPGYLIDGMACMWGYLILYPPGHASAGCNACPGAGWFKTVREAKRAIDILNAIGGEKNSSEFYKLLDDVKQAQDEAFHNTLGEHLLQKLRGKVKALKEETRVFVAPKMESAAEILVRESPLIGKHFGDELRKCTMAVTVVDYSQVDPSPPEEDDGDDEGPLFGKETDGTIVPSHTVRGLIDLMARMEKLHA